jgi:protein phosphatase 2C family protein 2/3
LHQFIIKQNSFPSNPVKAIRDGFQEAEDFFLEIVENAADEAMREAGETNYEGFVDNSGSCAIVILIVDHKVYVANVGDSRALMSADGGKKVLNLSTDHKPNEQGESERILGNGGKIYRTQTVVPKMDGTGNEVILGPHRVFPGRLSVSRSFGDIEAKLRKYGGNKRVIVADPEIRVFDVVDDMDYVILACDGIFDKLTNKEVIQTVWEGVMENGIKDPHKQ